MSGLSGIREGTGTNLHIAHFCETAIRLAEFVGVHDVGIGINDGEFAIIPNTAWLAICCTLAVVELQAWLDSFEPARGRDLRVGSVGRHLR